MAAVTTHAVARKSWKQQEFVAHGHNVNCLSLGPASGHVMVTGGDDRKVNMWALGKPNVIMSLAGHTSPVESVQFNSLEEFVVAGSQSGTLKIWNLDAAKIFRTLTGHKSSIKCTDFHPYGDYVASGSLDTNVKVWDIRRKGCIITYKGHTDAVNHLRFSPDGRWIVSGGEDGVIKLWDLTAGKLLTELKHAGPVNHVEFHPKEFLLATGSGDRTIKFWDLEKLCLVSSTEMESSAIRSIAFHPDGQCLLSGSNDSLKIYGWEPVRCFESFTTGWGKISDLVVTSDKVIGASFFQTNASIWLTDFKNIEEIVSQFDEAQSSEKVSISSEVSQGNKEVKKNEEKKTSPQRKVFETTKRPVTSSSKTRKPKTDQEVPVKKQTPEKDISPDDYHQVFTPRAAIDRSPPPRGRHPSQPAPTEELAQDKMPDSSTEPRNNAEKVPKRNVPDKVAKNAPEKTTKTAQVQSLQPQSVAPSVAATSSKPARKNQETKDAVSEPLKPDRIPSKAVKQTTLVPSDRNKPAGLYMEDFLPENDLHQAEAKRQDDRDIPSAPKITEAEAANVLQKGHAPFTAVVNNRHRNLTIVWRQWKEGDIKGAVQVAINMNDQSTLVDFLNVLCLKQTLWNLDLCSMVLPNLRELLSSRYESYVQTGASVIKMVLRNFAPVIKSNMAAPPVSIGVDVVREERFQKCQTCHAHLMALRSLVETKLNLSGRIGSLYRELSLLFSSLE